MINQLSKKHNFFPIYILAIILLVCGFLKIFSDNVKNNALVYLGIVSVFWGMSAQYRYYNPPSSDVSVIMEIPYSIKCFFGERECEKGDINIWVIIHVLIYFVAGILFPNRYIFFLIISVLCEVFEIAITSYNSKMFIDPIFNMIGYFIGNMVRKAWLS